MPVSNIAITKPGTQRARTAFTVSGTFDFLPPGGLTFSVHDSNGATTTITPKLIIKPNSFSYVNPGLTAGTHTIKVGAAGTTDVATTSVTVVRRRDEIS